MCTTSPSPTPRSSPPDCDLLQRLPDLVPGASARCPRCDRELWRRREDSLQRTLALALAAAALYVVANLPVVPRGRARSTATIGLRTGFMARWIGLSGYAIAVVLLLAIGITPWVRLLFPLWILLLSLDTLVESLGGAPRRGGPAEQCGVSG